MNTYKDQVASDITTLSKARATILRLADHNCTGLNGGLLEEAAALCEQAIKGWTYEMDHAEVEL